MARTFDTGAIMAAGQPTDDPWDAWLRQGAVVLGFGLVAVLLEWLRRRWRPH
jgi:hypothetical protein